MGERFAAPSEREVTSIASPQPDRAPYVPAPQPPSDLDSFFDIDEPLNAEAKGDIGFSKVVDAVDDATSTAKTAVSDLVTCILHLITLKKRRECREHISLLKCQSRRP